jgi:3-oxoacyl-(acyl-carrier-protein) synthase
MKQFLILILASGFMLACSSDSNNDAAANDVVDVVSEADADAAAEAAMSTAEGADAELDKMAKELDG